MMSSEEDIIEYAERISSEESSVLKKLSRETHLKVPLAHMISGVLQGKLLKMISCMIRPEKILEIGTFTGYSAICLSEGLSLKGKLHTIDINPELEDMVKRYLTEAGLEKKVVQHIGDAKDIIPGIQEIFDLVFIDADKENYLNYYKVVFEKVRTGGYILADNVLWDGKVLQENRNPDKETRGIVEFNEFIKKDERVEKLLLPFRDGLMIMRKK
jgi:caffeoyl-CoA O-methyltransferase